MSVVTLQQSTSVRQLRMRVVRDDSVYPGLKKFKCHGKELVNLPRSLFNLLDLEFLDLSPERQTCLYYQLSRLPDEICHLPLLKVLVLDTNQLRQLPEQISMLKHLEYLTLSNNQLSTLPQAFSKLTQLKSLHCANNKFHDLPKQLMAIKELSFLDFSSNCISALPNNISELRSLVTLLLNYNELTKLPDSICDMTSLNTLWLSGNRLHSLPNRFGELVNLDWAQWCPSVVLDDNPLQSPPLRIAKQGCEAISNYFKHKQEKTTASYC